MQGVIGKYVCFWKGVGGGVGTKMGVYTGTCKVTV